MGHVTQEVPPTLPPTSTAAAAPTPTPEVQAVVTSLDVDKEVFGCVRVVGAKGVVWGNR